MCHSGELSFYGPYVPFQGASEFTTHLLHVYRAFICRQCGIAESASGREGMGERAAL